MFVDSFVLKKTAWHCRLMKYIWGLNHYDFSHICPYFWLSIFNVIISPIFLPIKFFFKTFLPKYFWKYVKIVLKWMYKYVERFLSKIGDKLDAWAIKEQEKYEARRREEIARLDTKENLLRFIKLNQYQLAVLKDGNKERVKDLIRWDLPPVELERKKMDQIYSYIDTFIDMHRLDSTFWDRFLTKREEYLNNLREESAADRVKDDLKRAAAEQRRTKDRLEARKKDDARRAAQEAEEVRVAARRSIYQARMAEKEAQRKLRQPAIDAQRARNKQRIVKILKIAKPVATGFVWLLGGSLALLGLYWLYRLGDWAVKGFKQIPHTDYVKFGHGTLWVVGIVIALCLVILTIVGGVWLHGNIDWIRVRKALPKVHIPKVKVPNPFRFIKIPWHRIKLNKWIFKPMGRFFTEFWRLLCVGVPFLTIPFIWIYKGFIAVFKGVKLFFQILIQTIKNNCPAIRWEDR